jgi:hypothetical protein
MDARKHVELCLNFIRTEMAKCSGSELETLEVFADYIGSEVQGWEDRMQELKRDDEE